MTPSEKRYDEFRSKLRQAKMANNQALVAQLYREYEEELIKHATRS